jgi:hypothetical protein
LGAPPRQWHSSPARTPLLTAEGTCESSAPTPSWLAALRARSWDHLFLPHPLPDLTVPPPSSRVRCLAELPCAASSLLQPISQRSLSPTTPHATQAPPFGGVIGMLCLRFHNDSLNRSRHLFTPVLPLFLPKIRPGVNRYFPNAHNHFHPTSFIRLRGCSAARALTYPTRHMPTLSRPSPVFPDLKCTGFPFPSRANRKTSSE